MKQEWKEKWTEALRSGRYRQVDGTLRHESAMCCLGVLCDIVNPNDWTAGEGAYNTDLVWYYHGEDNLPPDDICDLVEIPRPVRGGLNEDNPATITNDLAKMNDEGISFAEIADYIEANL